MREILGAMVAALPEKVLLYENGYTRIYAVGWSRQDLVIDIELYDGTILADVAGKCYPK